MRQKNTRLMSLLKGVGYDGEPRITEEELMTGRTDNTFATVLVGRVIIKQIVEWHNEMVSKDGYEGKNQMFVEEFTSSLEEPGEDAISWLLTLSYGGTK